MVLCAGFWNKTHDLETGTLVFNDFMMVCVMYSAGDFLK